MIATIACLLVGSALTVPCDVPRRTVREARAREAKKN